MNPAEYFPEYLPRGLWQPVRFLQAELAPYPGRANLMLRSVLASALIIVSSLALEVPWLAVSLIAVFYVTQSNVVMTRLVCVLFIVAVSLAVGTAILLLKFTYDYPLIRIVAASVLFFGSVYLMRVLKVGMAFFVVAIVIIYVQSFVDRTDNADLLVRLTLWVWVAVAYAIVLTLLINTLLSPAEPERQLKAEIHRQLQAIDARLAYLLGSTGTASPIGLRAVQQGALTLQKLLKFTMMRDARYRADEARHLAYIATVARLYYAASELPPTMKSTAPEYLEVLANLRKECAALDAAIASDTPFLKSTPSEPQRRAIPIAPVEEMRGALQALLDREATPAPPRVPSAKESMMAADAFTNPVYAQFSLKTLLAVLVCYVFYNAADWQGVHTVMLTCLIVASPSLGASTQKSLLRIVGAAIGSALALFMMVFVIPHLDDVVGVLLMALPVIALGAWVSAGSERMSYAGMQLMFTFALALLEQFGGPSTDLTAIRDRAIGILLGVAVSILIHASIWPEGEGDPLRRSLADLLRTIGELLRPISHSAAATAAVPRAQQQLLVWEKLDACETLLARVALEPSWQESEHEQWTLRAQTILAEARAMMLASNALQGELSAQSGRLPVEVRDAVFSIQEQAAAVLKRYAAGLVGNASELPIPILLNALEQRFANLSGAAPATPDFTVLLNLVDNLVRRLAHLPSWGAPLPAPTGLHGSPSPP
jgi:multidrug resistance protein MdtO